MKIVWLVIGAILVIIASAILIATVGYSYSLINAWLIWAVIGTIYGIGAVMVFYGAFMPSRSPGSG
jgi:Leu/Phe-tRNA-protein transferase